MNDDPNHPLYQRGVSISRAGLRRVDELARSLEEASAAGDGGILGAFDEAGVQVGFNTTPGYKAFAARLIGQNSAPYADMYSFVAILTTPNGSSGLTLNNDLNYFFYPANTYNAKELNGNTTIPVPAGPSSLAASLVAGGTLTVSTKYYWVVTANLTNTTTSASVQSPLSNEVNLTPTTGNQTASLSWVAPTVPTGFTLTGYSVWRGTSAGGESVLVTSGIAAGTTTYSDTGSAGSSQSPVVGGTAGPIVWIWPSAVEDFWEFEYQPAPTTGVSFSGARYLGNGVAQNLSSGIYTVVTFDGTKVYDTDNYTKSLAVPVRGYYRGYFQISFPSASAAYTAGISAIGTDSTQYGQVQAYVAPGMFGGAAIVQCTFEGHFATGVSLQCQAMQNSGGTLGVTPRVEAMSIILIPAGTLSSEGM